MWLVAILVCAGWILSLCFHEFCHALVAYWGGDISVKDKGYLTFNPLKYTDPGLSLVLPLFFLLLGGIALPGGAVYINHSLLRDRKWESAVSAAGPLANVLIVLALSIPFQLGWNRFDLTELNSETFVTGTLIFVSLAFLILINIYVILINLLPIPSLDGYGIIDPWLPHSVQRYLKQFGKYGIWILIGLLWFVRPFNQFLWNLTETISEFLKIPVESALIGGEIFRQYSVVLVVGLLAVLWLFGSKEKQWYVKGNNWVGVKRYSRALTCYDRALKIKPDYIEAWQGKGYVLMQLQRYEEAIACYDKAIELNPQQSQSWFVRGLILTNLQRYEEAIASFDKATLLQPDGAEIWLYRGQTLLELQQYETAIASFDRTISLQPKRDTTSYAWYYRSYALSRLKREEEAISACDRAIELQPNSGVFWMLRGDLFAASGRDEESLASYEQAFHFQPNLSEARNKRDRLLKKLNLLK
ncbi:MAG: tetratricopeptide repeat protein [Cyanobacteriota bacterium]|nr:tetratricopeptide repeat protein [Cyanobacteriota bacterium]